MAYSKENSGALFKNDRKQSTKHPDYTGKLDVNGQSFRIAGWMKVSQTTQKPFMSLSISVDERGAQHVPDEDAAF
jgi:uncharacterized protein (DUF736 family)